MSITLKGHILNQRQLDAIVPVLNEHIKGHLTKKGFDDRCVEALEKAGCPLGYDTTLPGATTTVAERAVAWIRDGQVGLSSRAIHDHMLGLTPKRGEYSHPHDPADLNRCLLLLELIPEWKPRMPEMAEHGTEWAALIGHWDELVALFLDEVGLDWSKGKRLSATKTYNLMRRILP